MVVVYTKPDCVQCTMTKKYLDKNEVEYTTVDITEDSAAYDLVVSKGFMAAPVVNSGENWWSGFRPDNLKTLH